MVAIKPKPMTVISSLYVHMSFCVKSQQPVLTDEISNLLIDFFALRAKRCQALLVDACCMPDHVHLIVKYSPYVSVQEVHDELKAASHAFINTYQLTADPFAWTDDEVMICIGFSDLESLKKYFRKQKDYHVVNGKTWKDEILDLLDTHEFPFAEEEWMPLVKI